MSYATLLSAIVATSSLFTLLDANSIDISSSWTTKSLDLYSEYSPSAPNRIKVKDNRKPVFTNCYGSDLNATVMENRNLNTYVTTVRALDADPPNEGGTITYKIILRDGERSKFTINSTTGQIFTNLIFDRDEPLRQKEAYITVQATDNGRPVLADICSFKITILDENENQPIFDKANYAESVSVDARVNNEVMRISATDIDDGENARITYELLSNTDQYSQEFTNYFKIDSKTGVVSLIQSLGGNINHKFNTTVIAKDNGVDPKSTSTEIEITVVGSEKKPPTFTKYPNSTIYLDEDFRDFETTIAALSAESNIPDSSILFELVVGKTQQSNKDLTFKLTPIGLKEAKIILGRPLDYESINEYTLTVRIQNKDSLAASININIKLNDVNDEIPAFIELIQGTVLENEAPGTPVMQVRAVDLDGTDKHNIVTYSLVSQQDKDNFNIDAKTGNITTRKEFDRESQSVYNVRIRIEDNSKSALRLTGHNFDEQDFRILIEDRNDNPPTFTESTYLADQVLESTDIGKDVLEVTAKDKDTASQIVYRIIHGNIGDSFEVVESTGEIKVKNRLDFEHTENYTLIVEAFDGQYSDNATVIIKLANVNDELPIFEEYEKNITFQEEKTSGNQCIITLQAYDPDIKDRQAPQNIVYRVLDEFKDFLAVDNSGCVTIIKALDRDPPNFPTRQAFIVAYDENAGPSSQNANAEINIHLLDINDNAPFLKVTEVVWDENQIPGRIVELEADDIDDVNNGPPFTFSISSDANDDILQKFDVRDGVLHALEEFDREEKKYYIVPISIIDSGEPRMQNISYMKVIIGDVNDNEMQSGTSEIFVYDYMGTGPTVQIGRVFVNDLDDWDLPDKTFEWELTESQYFTLNNDNGTITKLEGTPAGSYRLNFTVTEESHLIPRHHVKAYVHVMIKSIPEEAVIKSGSIRMEGITAEQFIEKNKDGKSKKDILQSHLARVLNTSLENVDVFTVISNDSLLDVRFSAHGSPYYMPEKLNAEITSIQEELVKDIGGKFVMININECMLESVCPPNSSCSNKLKINKYPAVVYTNQTSFVGVSAVVEANCNCDSESGSVFECLNQGTSIENSACHCSEGFDGPHCEKLDVSFKGDGWALYPSFSACNSSELIVDVSPNEDNCLIFYIGPQSVKPAPIVRDFMSLQLENGYPLLLVDYGTGVVKIENSFKKVTDGNRHQIKIVFHPEHIEMTIDGCKNSTCTALSAAPGSNKLLNVNGPLQLGGVVSNLQQIGKLLEWEVIPSQQGFIGCVHSVEYNGKTYDLGAPALEKYLIATCDGFVAKAITFGIDTNFLIAILICIAILILLLLAVVVHKRKHDNLNEKDIDDIRENIINYEDEGGGEVDTGYDLTVLRGEQLDLDKPPMKDGLYGQCADVPDISGFLDNKKDVCDRDPENNPFDDVRYYAYEGDGNTTGSLSSLASCTDEGDLKFNYLSNFGPRFRKLADMYGEEPSDDDSHDGGEESWC